MIIEGKTYYLTNNTLSNSVKPEFITIFKGEKIINESIYVIIRKNNNTIIQLLMENGEKPLIPEGYGFIGFKYIEDTEEFVKDTMGNSYLATGNYYIEKRQIDNCMYYIYQNTYLIDPEADIKIFLSQPMSELDLLDIVNTRLDAEKILSLNYEGKSVSIINNLQLNAPDYYTNFDYMSEDIKMMKNADIVVFVKNWKNAKGCRIEHTIAVEYGKTILYLDSDTHTISV